MKRFTFIFPAAAALIMFTSCAQQDMGEFFPEQEAQSIEAASVAYQAEKQESGKQAAPGPTIKAPQIMPQVGVEEEEAWQARRKQAAERGDVQILTDGQGVDAAPVEEEFEGLSVKDPMTGNPPMELPTPVKGGARNAPIKTN